MAHKNRLENARVVVFGGTSGIGFAVASLGLSQGSTVVISGSKQPKVDDKVAKLRSLYPNLPAERVSGHALDLSDSANLESGLTGFFEKVTEGGKNKVDHVVFTAGDLPGLPQVREVTADSALFGFGMRYLGAVFIAKVLLNGNYMPVSADSSITLTGGTNTHKPMKGWGVAAGWGGAIEGLSRGLAVDLAPIRVNMVEAGAINTELLGRFAAMPGALEKLAKNTTILGQVGEPEEVAEAYGWLMRDRFVTGAIAGSHGGRYLAGPGMMD